MKRDPLICVDKVEPSALMVELCRERVWEPRDGLQASVGLWLMSWIHVDVLFLIRLAVPPVGMCLGLVIPSEKKPRGKSGSHSIQSGCSSQFHRRFSMCGFSLGMTMHCCLGI